MLRKLWVYGCAALLGCVGCKSKSAVDGNAAIRSASLAKRTLAAEWVHTGFEHSTPYRLYVPEGYDTTKSYPLVVTMHGAGARGTDNLGQLDESVEWLVGPALQQLEPTFVLAPQCPKQHEWLDVKQKAPYLNYKQANIPESERTKMALQIVAQVTEKYSIDPGRRYVTGVSMGAAATWDMITRHPETFAAAIPINGVNDPAQAAKIVSLPIHAFHGIHDGVSPIANTRKMMAAIKAAVAKKGGSAAAQFTEIDGGHGIVSRVYERPGLFAWMLEQRRP